MNGLYTSAEAAPWERDRWPNFKPQEIACGCGECEFCGGEVFVDEHALDCLQRLRNAMAAPVVIVSGHRCAKRNRRIGGAAHSAHLQLAFDLALGLHDRATLFANARGAGFSHFGFMRFGLHVDTRPAAAAAPYWTYGPESQRLWGKIVPSGSVDIGGV
jgi:hypothetical protein